MTFKEQYLSEIKRSNYQIKDMVRLGDRKQYDLRVHYKKDNCTPLVAYKVCKVLACVI